MASCTFQWSARLCQAIFQRLAWDLLSPIRQPAMVQAAARAVTTLSKRTNRTVVMLGQILHSQWTLLKLSTVTTASRLLHQMERWIAK